MIVKESSLRIRDLIESFLNVPDRYAEISKIKMFFTNKAKDIQVGDCEYVASKEWLNVWWPADELIFIKLCYERKLETFYKEAEVALSDFLLKHTIEFPNELLHDSIRLNKNLIKVPFVESDLNISLNYNIYCIFQGLLNGIDVPLGRGHFNSIIDRTSEKWNSWNDWSREVVWYGSKKGAYLYSLKPFPNEASADKYRKVSNRNL